MRKHKIKDQSILPFFNLVTKRSEEKREMERWSGQFKFPNGFLAFKHELPFLVEPGDTITFESSDSVTTIDLQVTGYIVYKAEVYDDFQVALKLTYRGIEEPKSWDHDNNQAINDDDLPF